MNSFYNRMHSATGLAGANKGWIGLLFVVALFGTYACSSSSSVTDNQQEQVTTSSNIKSLDEVTPPSPDPRIGLKAGLFDAEEAIWNLDMLSTTPPPEDFVGVTNSDLAFKGNYAFQGNYNGFMVWDLSNPANPNLVVDFLCPASQSDVSVYGDLLFVSGEGLGGRLDCGTEGVNKKASDERLRGIRIFDISDIENPKYVSNVQTCRGSHTHSVLDDPQDDENVYVYVSGSAPVRPNEELPGCSDAPPSKDPNSALFRIEVIQVPLDNPENAKIVNSPRIFENLTEAPTHGMSPADKEQIEKAKEEGAFVAEIFGQQRIIPDRYVQQMLAQVVKQRGGEGQPTAQDSATLRENIGKMIEERFGGNDNDGDEELMANRGPNQCHDITLYPEIGLAGGACEGYGLLLDIKDPANPKRVDAVADSNFAYWHSATFNNEGDKVLFTDEWGGGGQPKCREKDPMEWGANAIFTISDDNKMDFQSYFKMPAPQTAQENCVAHNGSLIPVPDRDIMVQSWYQGGISVFDWTDPNNPVEIAYHDRGPVDSTRMQMGGSWSVYWYNGVIVNSEIARGLDIFELKASPYLTKNEIEAANTVTFEQLNPQGQPKYDWPATFALAKAYVDQLERSQGLTMRQINNARTQIASAENASGSNKSDILTSLANDLDGEANNSSQTTKVNKLVNTLEKLAAK
ncbi:LVIVD repeat-containing protein [Fodinibius sp. SL11]|uniref:LVIVD repeat-containing protein n=1 Tax=Fodinibius sp. SL11 TaxID=3425690 RepID=UPI003F880648